MKRLLSILVAAMLLLGVAGPGMAMVDGTLIQVIYEGPYNVPEGLEYYTALGSGTDFTDLTRGPITAGQPSAYTPGDYGWFDDKTVAFFSQKADFIFEPDFDVYQNVVMASRDLYTPAKGSPVYDASTMQIHANNVDDYATSGGSANKSFTYSYTNEMNSYQGYYATGLDLDYTPGEKSLAGLDAAGDYVELYLWNYINWEMGGTGRSDGYLNPDGTLQTGNPVPVAIARIGLDAEGDLYTELNPVPIPGSVLLLGSGLLGLFGIRRKRS